MLAPWLACDELRDDVGAGLRDEVKYGEFVEGDAIIRDPCGAGMHALAPASPTPLRQIDGTRGCGCLEDLGLGRGRGEGEGEVESKVRARTSKVSGRR